MWSFFSRHDDKYLNSFFGFSFVLMFSDREEKVPASCCALFRRSLEEGSIRSCCGSDGLCFIYSPAPLPRLPFETCLHLAQSATLISLTPSIVLPALPSTRLSTALFSSCREHQDTAAGQRISFLAGLSPPQIRL